MVQLSALTMGVFLDWLFGEPDGVVHPVVLMGRCIAWAERWLRKKRAGRDRSNGRILVVLVVFVSVALPCGILAVVRRVERAFWPGGGWFSWCLCTFWSFQLLAARGLYEESGKVRKALVGQDEEEARRCVSRIVGRDTQCLDSAGITRAAVETVAENTSDGVIAPMLFLALFGIAGGFFYKAVNTMDSMVGYKNDQYRLFGRAAARLDDGCNFLPARITGGLLVLAAWILGGQDGSFDGRNAWRIFRRDRRNHASPNSAHGEAACAGALHIRLAGDAWYFGKRFEKPYIGDNDRPVEAEDIRRAGKLMIAAEVLGLLFCWGGRMIFGLLPFAGQLV